MEFMPMAGNRIIYIRERIQQQTSDIYSTLTLPYHLRIKHTQRNHLDNKEDVILALPQGTRLYEGDLLRSEDDLIIEVKPAIELVYQAKSNATLQLFHACYYLGLRHIPVQIMDGTLLYHDYERAAPIMAQFNFEVSQVEAIFEPIPMQVQTERKF
jgi:urease accessory protein